MAVPTIRVYLLKKETRELVLTEYRTALKEVRYLSYEEAAWYYGFTYQTIRHYIHEDRLRPVKKPGKRYLTHAEMRRYLAGRKATGCPRKSQRTQLTLA